MEKKKSDISQNTKRKVPQQPERIIVFARAPLEGRVKTRLSPELDSGRILSLYKCFVTDMLNMLKQTGRPLCLCFDPPDAQNIMRNWLSDDIAFQAQDGNDLGEKMANAFASAFASGVERAVLIGTDTPDLSTEIIARSFFALTDHDAVIGPAADGGYYLIGFRSETFCHGVFETIPWSTASVYAATLARLSAYSASVYRLPEWRDIDHYADLCALGRLLALKESSAPATAAFLKETGICSIGNRT